MTFTEDENADRELRRIQQARSDRERALRLEKYGPDLTMGMEQLIQADSPEEIRFAVQEFQLATADYLSTNFSPEGVAAVVGATLEVMLTREANLTKRIEGDSEAFPF